ncbi:N-acetyltransferase family protein [Roseobacteraceae bacterium S113]
MSVQLRPARSTDAGKLGAILSAFIDETDWMLRLHSRAEDVAFAGRMIEHGWVTVAEQDGVVCAFCARNGGEINALYVASRMRRNGLGSALLAHAQDQADALELWTHQPNTVAQAFYLAHGFREAERTDGASNEENVPDIRYVWSSQESAR